jgi:hypothetical protein
MVKLNAMEQQREPLSYARPMPPPDRPPMHSLVLTVLASGFLIVLGGAFVLGSFVTMAYQFSLWLILLIGMGVVFTWVGIRSMWQTVHFLKGGKREGEWRQWMFAAPSRDDSNQDSDKY